MVADDKHAFACRSLGQEAKTAFHGQFREKLEVTQAAGEPGGRGSDRSPARKRIKITDGRSRGIARALPADRESIRLQPGMNPGRT